MIPRTISSNLASLRRRERLICLAWGVCRWIAVTVVLLAVCVAIDFAVDYFRDTPWSIRYALFAAQALVAAAGGLLLVLWPQLRPLRDPELALWIEARTQRLQHRLITAVELNHPRAQTEGMSTELIAVVTREAETLVAGIDCCAVADHRRLRWGLAVILPVLLVAGIPLAVWPSTMGALLQRQALLDVDVPRRIHLKSDTPDVLPIDEKFRLQFRVSGAVATDEVGTVRVRPEGQSAESYDLQFARDLLPDGDRLFDADLPRMSSDFTYTARLGDGRTRRPRAVHFVARPVVTRQEAWLRLPAYCGTTDGKATGPRYEQAQQGHGDVVGIPGSEVRLTIHASKPIHKALIELLGPQQPEQERSEDDPGPEEVKRVLPMTIAANGSVATLVFDMRPEESAYRVVVSDEHGFVNVPAPRRSIRVVPESQFPPQVALLKDYFGPDADSDVEGIPVKLGSPIRIPYAAYGPFGLGQASILYRVVRKQGSDEKGNQVEDTGEFTELPLPEVTGTPKLGVFDPKRGVFEHSGLFDQVPFHAVPSLLPQVLGRQVGGGRYFLQTAGLTDAQGRKLDVKPGDQIEYRVKLFADRDRNRRLQRPISISDTRVTTVVDETQFDRWVQSLIREEEQLRKLESAERGVLGK